MNRLFVLNGMKRSGNHAFVMWMAANADVLFFNNVVALDPIMRGKRPMPEPLPFRRWLRQQKSVSFLAKIGALGKDVLASFEDLDPHWSLFSKTPRRTSSILILRDPYNLFASRIRAGGKLNLAPLARPPDPVFQGMIELWKVHARVFLNETDARVDVPVYYNSWFSSREYRSYIADRLGIRSSDAGLDVVSEIGGGSSFDGTEYDGRARQMTVLNRTADLTDQERGFLAIVENDPEIRAIHERVEAAAERWRETL